MDLPAGHVHRFPPRSALLAGGGVTGRVGDLARALSRGTVSYRSAEPQVDAEADALLDAGAALAMPVLAGLHLLGLTWLEVTRADRTGYGQLGGRDGKAWSGLAA